MAAGGDNVLTAVVVTVVVGVAAAAAATVVSLDLEVEAETAPSLAAVSCLYISRRRWMMVSLRACMQR